MSDELRRRLDEVSADASPVALTFSVLGRAAQRRRRRRAAGRLAAAAAGGAAMVGVVMVALVVALSVLGPMSPGTGLPAAAGTAGRPAPSPAAPEQASAIGQASTLPTAAAQPVAPAAPGTVGEAAAQPSAPADAVSAAPAATAADPAGRELSTDASSASPSVTVRSPTPDAVPLIIDAGGPGAGRFQADAGFTGGTSYSLTVAVNTTAEPSAVPAMYSTVRYGTSFDYDIQGLSPGSAHRLRLHWAELDFLAAGDRVFDVWVNGVLVLDGMDVVKATGTFRRVVVREVDVVADASGHVVVEFRRGGKDNPFISGLELLPR